MTESTDAGIWAEGSPLTRQLVGYQLRSGQVRMAAWITEALADRQARVIEAGTGIGKTFAYLVPVLTGTDRVLISTATLALQDQIMGKDLPFLQRALGVRRHIALLKGRGRYLCRYRFSLAEQDLWFDGRGTLGRIRPWAEQTPSGDLSECADLPAHPELITRITATGDTCLGQECPEFKACHVLKARRAAMEAEVVVINHHLLFADLALRGEGFGELLPGADAVVVDEAHQFAEVAAHFFGSTVSTRQMSLLMRDLRVEMQATGGGDHPDLMQTAESMEAAAQALRRSLPEGERRFAWEGTAQHTDFASQRDRLRQRLDALVVGLEAVAERSPGLAQGLRRAENLRDALMQWGNTVAGEERVHWLQTTRTGVLMHATPLEVGPQLQEFREQRPCAWVFTSATLAVGSDFSGFLHEVGLNAQTPCLQLPSPFDYPRQALMYLPTGLPLPDAPGYDAAYLDQVRTVLEWSGGRAFLLFTSHRALRHAAGMLADLPFPLLIQGEAPPAQLLAQFQQAGNAVLLGAASFWAGVDVRGSALQLVAIDRLPFASPDDPVLQARLNAVRARGGNPFRECQLPAAVITLRQGAGRLIRDAQDRGVLLLGDGRLVARSYGRTFLASLPPMPMTRDASEVANFFATLRTEEQANDALTGH
jgi:ATP-dependent DNA helicase DinG